MGVFIKNNNWYIDYYVNGRRKRESVGSSKKLAETVLQKRKVEIAEGKFLDIKRNRKIKFEDFAEEYREIYLKTNYPSWERSAKYNIDRLKKFFEGRYLHEITPLLVEQFKQERLAEVKQSTVNRGLSCLRAMFNRASEWGKFDGRNPVSKIKFFKESNGRLRYLEKEEITKLLECCSQKLKPIIVVALNTGMRRGEILNLKWGDIDVKRDIIYLLKTKNGERREIPMNALVKQALIAVPKDPSSPYIFYHHDNKPYNLRKSFFTACKKAGIINFRFHDLRHTFASQLVMSGVDLNTVRELLGHKSLEMTLRYSHLSPDHKKRAVDTLGHRIDTFWTLDSNKDSVQKESELINI